jgi:para-aminobenzoate synthetase component I
MQRHPEHRWIEPLSALSALRDEPMLLCFYSAFSEAHTGRYSFLCWQISQEITGTDFECLRTHLSNNRLWHENAWFGWLGYGLRHTTESLPKGAPEKITHPPLTMIQFAHMVRFDHALKSVEYYYHTTPDLRWQSHDAITHPSPAPAVNTLTSNMTTPEYLEIVATTREQILAGNFYQANITRKYYGTLSAAPSAAELFFRLTALSPAPYSALIKRGRDILLSSSPECFISVEENGIITARPIKGSAAVSQDASTDESIRNALICSEKNHAENRMIVDLMRNDLARCSNAGSVQVPESATLHSYTTIHHLIATIQAQKSPELTALDVIERCFPAGSMTGAPKIAAMRWCAEKERVERGIYSGAIGWFSGSGACDFSVVIRTLLIREHEFEFQVGGGIVADSVPHEEWLETLTKARAICNLLGIAEDELRGV